MVGSHFFVVVLIKFHSPINQPARQAIPATPREERQRMLKEGTFIADQWGGG
jgi:hypothetical protein